MTHKKGTKLGKYCTDTFLYDIKIDSDIKPPPCNMTSPWSHLAWRMKVGDSVELGSYDHALKLKYCLARLGFLTIRRKLGENTWRVWKVTKEFNKRRKIPKTVRYAKRTIDIICQGDGKR